ncbi:MAG: SLC13/DASS family transporter [Desulfobacteraceae bacterium]|jgi:sodium-dependent dicarboxylate transporter 2/3/5|nr:MAG: SLC13/DASS family transporter [Desulfobacteraceae bacterium]
MTANTTAKEKSDFDWKRLVFIAIGVGLFLLVYYSPPWPNAVDPMGKEFVLSPQAKGALALFLLAGTFWVFEVLPIGVTGILIGVIQALFFIRPASEAFKDFMDPSVLFIFGSLTIGMVFTKVGLTKRLAYKMLMIVGERTSRIYLGCFIVTALLTHIMAHTAVAATMYPLLLAIYSLYTTDTTPTKFGKGLFIGMAFVAGAGSIITLLGAARGIVALGFYKEIAKQDVSFFELTFYMAPIGWFMVFLLWGFIMVMFKPEQDTIPGLRDKARQLNNEMGALSGKEIGAALIVLGAILFLSLQSFVPALQPFNKSAVILVATILFFAFKILDIHDLEDIPWNIILLFAGAMSIGFCLWQTGAAEWLAINWLGFFKESHWFVFVMGIAFFILVMTNFIMNVAAIAISLPVALVVAPYLGVSGEVILFAALTTAGMPFLLLVGAAPNAIAYNSKQFTSGEFFTAGIPASILLLAVLGLTILLVWPLMGMQVTLPVTP